MTKDIEHPCDLWGLAIVLHHHNYHVHCDHQDDKDLKLTIFHHIKHHCLIAILQKHNC